MNYNVILDQIQTQNPIKPQSRRNPNCKERIGWQKKINYSVILLLIFLKKLFLEILNIEIINKFKEV